MFVLKLGHHSREIGFRTDTAKVSHLKCPRLDRFGVGILRIGIGPNCEQTVRRSGDGELRLYADVRRLRHRTDYLPRLAVHHAAHQHLRPVQQHTKQLLAAASAPRPLSLGATGVGRGHGRGCIAYS